MRAINSAIGLNESFMIFTNRTETSVSRVNNSLNRELTLSNKVNRVLPTVILINKYDIVVILINNLFAHAGLQGTLWRNTPWCKLINSEQVLWNEPFIWTDSRKGIIITTDSYVENEAWLVGSWKCQSLITHDCVYNYYTGGSHSGRMMMSMNSLGCRQMHGFSGKSVYEFEELLYNR